MLMPVALKFVIIEIISSYVNLTLTVLELLKKIVKTDIAEDV